MSQEVAIIIPIWKSESTLGDCLDALKEQNGIELVIIDNASKDSSLDILKQSELSFKYHRNETNRGFSVACNQGIALSKSPLIMMLNDDVVLGENYLSQLTKLFARCPDLGSATGKLTFAGENGQRYIDSTGLELHKHALRPHDRGQGELDDGRFDESGPVFGVSGAAPVYRRQALLDVGPEVFDESFFAYYEDVDLAWRLHKAGWTALYHADATAEHRRRGPKDKPAAIRKRAFGNRYVMWAKNESLLSFLSYALIAFPWEVVRILRIVVREGIWPHEEGVGRRVWSAIFGRLA